MQKIQSVWAVVATYGPDARLQDALARLIPQTSGVIIVDDATPPARATVLDGIASDPVTVLRQDSNVGIAATLNRGIEHAWAAGADAVVTFDQDSVVDSDFISRLAATVESAGQGDVALVVPEFFAGVRQAYGTADGGLLHARNVIQSGMLIPRQTWDRFGQLRADYFIDLVDTEYELRCRAGNATVIAAPGLRLQHELGAQYRRSRSGHPVHIPGLPDLLTLSTPFRYYYRARNRIMLTREYGLRLPGATIVAALVDAAHFVDATTAASDRRAFRRILWAGVRSGLRRRMGAIPPALATTASAISWRYPEVPREHGQVGA